MDGYILDRLHLRNFIMKDIIEYRHSEVIHEGGFPVNPFLRCILCRTQAERETLLYLLQRYSLRLYNTYKDRVLYKSTLKYFYKSYLIYIRFNSKINF